MKEAIQNWSVNALLLIAVLFAGLYFQGRANTAEAALCAIKANEERRVDSSEQYLEDVRKGRRDSIPGITESDIRSSISRSQDTIRALDGLHCP